MQQALYFSLIFEFTQLHFLAVPILQGKLNLFSYGRENNNSTFLLALYTQFDDLQYT